MRNRLTGIVALATAALFLGAVPAFAADTVAPTAVTAPTYVEWSAAPTYVEWSAAPTYVEWTAAKYVEWSAPTYVEW